MAGAMAGRRVVVTGANGLVGRAVLAELAGTPAEVTALVRKPADLPAGRVVPDWLASPQAAAALRQADAVVHLCGEIAARSAAGYTAANVDTTRRVVDHVGPGRRVVFVSYPGADPASGNRFLRAKGEAEELLRRSAAEAVVFRTQVIAHRPDRPGPFEDAIRQPKPGAAVRVIGRGRNRVRPIYQGDVVAAVLAAAGGAGRPGTYDLVGPDEYTLDDVVRLRNGDPAVPIAHTPGWLARVLGRVVPGLSPTFVDLYLRATPPGDPGPAVREFGLTLTPLAAVWAGRHPNSPTYR